MRTLQDLTEAEAVEVAKIVLAPTAAVLRMRQLEGITQEDTYHATPPTPTMRAWSIARRPACIAQPDRAHISTSRFALFKATGRSESVFSQAEAVKAYLYLQSVGIDVPLD